MVSSNGGVNIKSVLYKTLSLSYIKKEILLIYFIKVTTLRVVTGQCMISLNLRRFFKSKQENMVQFNSLISREVKIIPP